MSKATWQCKKCGSVFYRDGESLLVAYAKLESARRRHMAFAHQSLWSRVKAWWKK